MNSLMHLPTKRLIHSARCPCRTYICMFCTCMSITFSCESSYLVCICVPSHSVPVVLCVSSSSSSFFNLDFNPRASLRDFARNQSITKTKEAFICILITCVDISTTARVAPDNLGVLIGVPTSHEHHQNKQKK